MSQLDPSYITLRQFAEQRGMRTDKVAMQRLRRRLTKKQAHNPRGVFLIRLSDAPGDPLYTTLPLMREHCPELFDRRSEFEQQVRKEMAARFAKIDEILKTMVSRQSGLASKLREFRQLLAEHLNSPHPASPESHRVGAHDEARARDAGGVDEGLSTVTDFAPERK